MPSHCATLALSSAASAQDYPNRPVTFIVPYGAGGPVDTMARTLSEAMRASLGQPIVIENVTGANGTIGVGRAVHAAPDGYTVSIGNWPSHITNGAIYNLTTISRRTSCRSLACRKIRTSPSCARTFRPRTSRS